MSYDNTMKLTIKIKLITTPEQKRILLATMAEFNSAANTAARAGFDNRVFSQPNIHKLVYYAIRESTRLGAQLTVRAIGKAVECFKRDKKICPVFKPRSAIIYDERIMRFKGFTHVSLSTVEGRKVIPMVIASYQYERLQEAIKTGQADLVYHSGTFYLLVSIDFNTPAKDIPNEVVGVDLGVDKIAVDSLGNTYTGEAVEVVRKRIGELRSELQACGTRSAKRHLKRLKRYESNYRSTANHQIARRIVDTAKAHHAAIALEDLTGIRDRTRFRKSQRARISGWAFHQLRRFIEYKSELAGVTVIVVDPRNTSRTCSKCGHCDKSNRKSQSEFECRACGHKANADFNAARNLRAKGYVNKPIVTNDDPQPVGAGS